MIPSVAGQRALNRFLYLAPILLPDALHKRFEISRKRTSGLPVNPLHILGPLHFARKDVPTPTAKIGRFQAEPHSLFTFAQRHFHLLKLGHIPCSLGGAYHPSRSIFHRRDGERYGDSFLVFREPLSFKVLNTFPRPQPSQYLRFFTLKFRRNDQSDRLSHSVFFRVAEYALRTRVPAGDDPVKVFRDNCVLRRLHDRCQSGSYFFNRPLLGDIYARANVTLELALIANTGDSVTEYPAKFPVRTAQTVFHFVRLAGVKRGQIGIEIPLTIVGMDSFPPPIPQFLLQGSSGKVKPAPVEVRRKRVRTGNPNHRWHGIGHVLELPVLRLRRLLSIGRFRQWWLLCGLRRNCSAIRGSGLAWLRFLRRQI